MGTYATIDQIKAASLNIPPIVRGTDEDILGWAHEAYTLINNHCNTNFEFEQQVARSVPLGLHSDVYLPKTVSGQVGVTRALLGQSPVAVLGRYIEVPEYSYAIRYNGPRPRGLNPSHSTLYITADWGYAPSREFLLIEIANDLKTKYNAHRISTASHVSSDTVNGTTAPDATSLSSAITLLNNLLTVMAAHFLNAPVHSSLPTTLPSYATATTEDEAVTLATALKTSFNAHIASTTYHLAIDPLAVTISATNPILPDDIMLAFTKVLQRIAIRSNAEDTRYHNSGFSSESFSDGYSYNIDQGARHPIMPTEMALLSEYVNDGRVAY